MTQQVCRMAAFLIATEGNWRNAIYIDCPTCGCPHRCRTGILFAADHTGAPVLVSVQELYCCTGQQADKRECLGYLERPAFESAYRRYTSWHTDEPDACAVKQLLDSWPSLPCFANTKSEEERL